MAGGNGRKGLNRACFLLIVIAGVERFAFKGVQSNLVTYLTDVVKMKNASAAKAVNDWVGLTFLMPSLVVPFTDACWDRYTIIVASCLLYIVGLMALTVTALALAWYPSNSISSGFLFLSLFLISLGQGGFNPSLQAFGADQLEFDDDLPNTKQDQKPNKTFFFQSWYFGTCGGILSGITVMSYIQDTLGWVVGFAIPTIAMAASLVVFWSGSRIFTYKDDDCIHSRPFPNLVKAIKEVASKLRSSKIILSDENSEVAELELQEKPLCHQTLGSTKSVVKNSGGGSYIAENARILGRLLPIWTLLIMFAVIFQQPATFFTKQGMTMKRNIGSNFKIPAATLQSSITVSVIVLMPFYDKVLIPFTRLITRNDQGISVMQRMGTGMVLCTIAMIIAAMTESWRLRLSHRMSASQPDCDTVPLSIFWLLPQYILLGISDIFTVVGMQEFFYSQVPTRMKTMGIALYASVFGVGGFGGALLISLAEMVTTSRGKTSWFSDDMREARLDKFYWLLAFLSGLSLLFYVVLCKFYKSRSDPDGGNNLSVNHHPLERHCQPDNVLRTNNTFPSGTHDAGP